MRDDIVQPPETQPADSPTPKDRPAEDDSAQPAPRQSELRQDESSQEVSEPASDHANPTTGKPKSRLPINAILVALIVCAALTSLAVYAAIAG